MLLTVTLNTAPSQVTSRRTLGNQDRRGQVPPACTCVTYKQVASTREEDSHFLAAGWLPGDFSKCPGLTCEQDWGAGGPWLLLSLPGAEEGELAESLGRLTPGSGGRSQPHKHPHSPPKVRAGPVPSPERPGIQSVFNTYSKT